MSKVGKWESGKPHLKKVRFSVKKVAYKFGKFTKNSYLCIVVRKGHKATKFAA